MAATGRPAGEYAGEIRGKASKPRLVGEIPQKNEAGATGRKPKGHLRLCVLCA